MDFLAQRPGLGSMPFESPVAFLEFPVGHHGVDRGACQGRVSEDVHYIRRAAALLDDIMSHVVTEAVRVHKRYSGAVGIAAKHFAYSLDGEPPTDIGRAGGDEKG